MRKGQTVSNLEFSKWIAATSCSNALIEAQSFWNSQQIISSSSGAICFQRILDAGNNARSWDMEWLVQSKIECLKEREKLIVKDARRKKWEREDVINRIITSSSSVPKSM